MEAVDNGSRQSNALPPINIFNPEKEQADRKEAEPQRPPMAAAMISPAYPPPHSGLSHPYNRSPSYPAFSASSQSGAKQSGLISPPGSRRTSEQEKEQRQPTRQSLPSIHEALGSDQPLSYPVQPPPTPSSSVQYHQPTPATAAEPPRSTHPSESAPTPQEPTSSFSQPPARSPFMSYPSSAVHLPHSAHTQPELHRSSFSATHSKLPSLPNLRTAPSPVSSTRPNLPYSYSQQASPAFDPAPQSAGSVNGPFGYNLHRAAYPQSAPPVSAAQPIYQQPQLSAPPYHTTWPKEGKDFRTVEETRRASGPQNQRNYGESVKRHLDHFDYEASLNEIAETSGRLLEFSRHYSQKAHESQRSGPVPGSTPTIQEIEDMLSKNKRTYDSLCRMRDVVIAQHEATMAEQAQDHQRTKFGNGLEPSEANGYQEDPKGGGFAGADPKKRRGRAAPPGRCHSCNRAETPEWRRGPDGARTLCNACGLHYAKLTRKMNNNKAAIKSTDFRPKSMQPGSPAT